MPTSTSEGKQWTLDRIRKMNPATILDVGAGNGTYSDLARSAVPFAQWDAVEIFEPYITEYELRKKYNQVFNIDILDFSFGLYDLIILGDVLEHMPQRDAKNLITFCKERAKAIVVSVPIIYAPQGAVNGNEHETHQYHWTYEEMFHVLADNVYPGIHPGYVESMRGEIVGVYWWSSEPPSD